MRKNNSLKRINRTRKKTNRRKKIKKGGENTTSGSWSSDRRRRERGEEDLQSLSDDNFLTKRIKRVKRKKRKKRQDKVNKLREEMMKQIEQNTSDAEKLDAAQRSIDRRYLENNVSSDQFYSAPSSFYNSSGLMRYYSDPNMVQQYSTHNYNYSDPNMVQQPLNYNYDMRPQWMKDKVVERGLMNFHSFMNPTNGRTVMGNLLFK